MCRSNLCRRDSEFLVPISVQNQGNLKRSPIGPLSLLRSRRALSLSLPTSTHQQKEPTARREWLAAFLGFASLQPNRHLFIVAASFLLRPGINACTVCGSLQGSLKIWFYQSLLSGNSVCYKHSSLPLPQKNQLYNQWHCLPFTPALGKCQAIEGEAVNLIILNSNILNYCTLSQGKEE